MKQGSVIKPAFAGHFYPARKEELRNLLGKLFARVDERQLKMPPRAIIAPHAGYLFSGQVAASAYSQIPSGTSYEKVFVLASSHRSFFSGAAVCKNSSFQTPLGRINIDSQTACTLEKENSIFSCLPEIFRNEHSLEVQLPFLQYILGNRFDLVPIILGDCPAALCSSIAKSLEPYFTSRNLFVVSTDFSHYPAYAEAVENDLNTAEAICSNDPFLLLRHLENPVETENLATSLCGWTSVLSLLHLTGNKPVTYRKIRYMNSGDAEEIGDRHRVVGYWAIAVFDAPGGIYLSTEEQKALLQAARDAVFNYVKTGQTPISDDIFEQDVMEQEAGLFVTVYVDGQLRGCIGNLHNHEPLGRLVKQLAVSAACDNRFKGVTADDFNNMELEISVLSPLRKINGPEEFIPGKHGIFIKKGSSTGTFLPKVAAKTGWSREELLGSCSRDKAGLGWEGWKSAELYVYEAFVFKG